MKSGVIRRLAQERRERRDEARLPTAWVETKKEQLAAARPGTTHLLHADHAEPVEVAPGAPALVMLRPDHAPVMAELLALASAGLRVYVLAPAGWSQARPEPQLLACRTVLIRRVPEVPAAGVYTERAAKLWLGAAPAGAAPWCLRLDGEQATALRQLFLRLFWHHAADEGWTGGKQLRFRSAAERPFDVPELPHRAPLRLLATNTPPEFDSRGAWAHIPEGAPPAATPRRLWFPASGSHHQALARLVREGAEVVWASRELPYLLVKEEQGVAWLPGTQSRLLITLNPAQAADAARILADPPGWRFATELRLGDHGDGGAPLWLAGAAAACPVESEQVIPLADVRAETVRATAEAAPKSWPAAQPLALAVRYKWTALPPQLPADSEEDPLVGRWRQVETEWAKRRGKAREALQELDHHRGRLKKTFSRLLSAMLGFEQAQHKLLAELTALDEQRLAAAGPADAPGLWEQLRRLEEKLDDLQGGLKEAERKEREQQAREQQEREWKERIAAASQELAARRRELAENQEQLATMSETLAAVEDELKTADKQAKKELQVRQQRAADDLTRRKSAIKRLQGEVADLQQRAAEPFVFKPPAGSVLRPPSAAGRFVPQAPPPRPVGEVPEEALPRVGELRRQRGQRYLVIAAWEDLASGEQDAARLKARLVAPEDA